MKKGLSVLLIVAALFGFYGGASSLTDVLACKDYWEKEGEKSTADMNKLEDGLNQLGENEQAYLDGLEALAENEPKLEEGKQTLAEKEAEFAAAPAKLRKGEADLAAGKAAYKAGKAQYDAGKKQYNEAKATLESYEKKVSDLESGLKQWNGGLSQLAAGVNAKLPFAAKGPMDPYTRLINSDTNGRAMALDVSDLSSFETSLKTDIVNDVGQANLQLGIDYITAKAAWEKDHPGEDWKQSTEYQEVAAGEPYEVYATKYVTVGKVVEGIEPTVNSLVGARAEMTKQIKDFASKIDDETMKSIDPKGEIKTMLSLIDSVPDTDNPKMKDATFYNFVNTLLSKVKPMLSEKRAELAQGKKTLDAAEKELAAGAKKIKAGEAKLAKGYADYEAAPAKLAAGRQQLADGLKQLEEGKKQLAQYEDGEQQVRDGLATLMSTEPNGGLESILDRRGGDDEFDDANGHLDVQEGLDAVKVGRGYQADSGELITKEITNRAVGTAAGLGAAVLACLAALLSLIKKYKGAAVSAVLAAIAGVAGAVIGSGAGSEFSDIAGSTVGNLPWIAAGVTAAVACVFAIVNFTAKAE